MNKKIAIFHNFMDNIGGAEMVTLTLARDLNADLYSTNFDREKIAKMGFNNIKLISIGQVPINAPWRQQKALYLFRRLNLGNQYDYYIISGDWAVSGAYHNKPNLWYVHSPIREIWDLTETVRQQLVPWYGRTAFDCWVKINRWLNKRYVSQVEKIVCNSATTQARIKKYLGREAQIINPPIETENFFNRPAKDFWLSVNRLISHKRLEIQLDAFRKLPNEKLVIVGSYEPARHFKKYALKIIQEKPANVEILSWLDNKQLVNLYADCRGFITTSQDEDFGMNALEAMASGKPVIAPNEGGYRETVIDGVTGKLIDDIDDQKLAEAIKEIGVNQEIYKEACQAQAKKFDTSVFIEKIKAIINN